MEKRISDILEGLPQLSPDGVDNMRLARLVNGGAGLDLSEQCTKILTDAILNGLQQTVRSLPSQDGRLAMAAFETNLRKLLEKRASWKEISAVGWAMFKNYSVLPVAARLVQLAIMYGSPEDVITTLGRVLAWNDAAYGEIAADFRCYIVGLLWRQKQLQLIMPLFEKSSAEFLLPFEWLAYFYVLRGNDQGIKALNIYRQQNSKMIEACESYGKKIGLTAQRLLLDAGELALALGYEVYARQVLDQIGSEAQEYNTACELLFSLKIDRDERGETNLQKELREKSSPRQKIKLLESCLERTRKLGPIRDIGRPILNDVLSKLSTLFDPDVPTHLGLSQVLVEYASLASRLPALFTFFEDNMRSFHAPDEEHALWDPVLTMKSHDQYQDLFWSGVAHFHLFVCDKMKGEHHLWLASDAFSVAESKWPRSLKIKWSEINRIAYQAIANNIGLVDSARETLLLRLDILLDPSQIKRESIDRLVSHREAFPLAALKYLRRVLADADRPELEAKVIRLHGEHLHYTNQDLDRLWHLACVMNQSDRAWTIATILKSRGDLSQEINHAWDLSFEGKGNVFPTIPPRAVLLNAFADCSKNQQLFIELMVIIGHRLPELMAMVDTRAKKVKIKSPHDGSKQALAEGYLDKVKWISQDTHVYNLSGEYVPRDYTPPFFMLSCPDTQYAWLVLCLARRMGFAGFGWSLQKLRRWIASLYQGGNMKASDKIQRILARWLASLSSEEKAAWRELIKYKPDFPEEVAADLLARIVTRLAIIIYPLHYEALESLIAMRAPLSVIWDLEKFLLSPGYGVLRQKLEFTGRAIVPPSLGRLPSIRKSK